MSLVQAFQVFRSCTTSVSSRSIAHRSRFASSALRRGRRHYSTEEKPGENTETKDEPGEAAKQDGSDAKKPPPNPLEQKLKEKELEVVDLTGRLRYLQADFLNLQRNAAREKEQTRDFAITRFASDLLETVDVLSMALKSVPLSALSPPESSPRESPKVPSEQSSHSPPSPSPSSEPPPTKTAQDYLRDLHTGVEMTQRQLLQTLFKYHVKPFDPTGDPFDPNRHEALYQAPIPGKEPGIVVDCQKVGYTIKDRILRAAQVGVAQETGS